MQLAVGGPAKLLIGYSVALILEAAAGDKIEIAKDAIAEKVAVYLEAGGIPEEEFKQINCPNGDCSDKYASAGSYAINMTKDNAKFGINVIAGTVGSIISKKVLQAKHSKVLNTFREANKDSSLKLTQRVRFTQNNISKNFKDGKNVNDLIADLKSGKISSDDIPAIRVFEKDGKIYSLDNRRLKAFQDAKCTC